MKTYILTYLLFIMFIPLYLLRTQLLSWSRYVILGSSTLFPEIDGYQFCKDKNGNTLNVLNEFETV